MALDLSGWSGVLGCPRLPSMLLGNIFYHFLIGVALSRVQAAGGLPYKCFTTDKIQHNDAHGVSPSAGRSILEAFKYYTTDNRKSVTEDGIFSDDRQSSLSDSPAHLEAPIRISSREPRKEKSKFLSRGYPSMGLSLSSDGSAESTRTTLGHGLFTDSLGSIIARTALSILESPMGSRSTDTDSNAASLDAPKE